MTHQEQVKVAAILGEVIGRLEEQSACVRTIRDSHVEAALAAGEESIIGPLRDALDILTGESEVDDEPFAITIPGGSRAS